MNTSRSLLLPVVFALALACSLTTANAAVLYDSRAMAIDGSWNNARRSMIGGFADNGLMLDHQVADDFTVTSPVALTSVTADFWTGYQNMATPANGWLVEVFADAGGRPSATPTHAVWGASGAIVGSFAWTGGGGFSPEHNIPQRRSSFEIDLASHNVMLDPGTWWISIVAVDETPFGTEYYWVGQRPVPNQNGFVAHARFGGPAHGNGYIQPDGIGPNWTAMTTSSQTSNARPYEMSMRIEGTIIPAPAATALLSLCGLTALNRRRRG